MKIFEINGIEADYEDFGEKRDLDPKNRPYYGCGNMAFVPKDPTEEILNKYNISVYDYDEICDKLETHLSFGRCAWCS